MTASVLPFVYSSSATVMAGRIWAMVGFLLGAGFGRRLRRSFGLRLDFRLCLRLGLNLSFRSRFARPRVRHVVVALDPELVVEGGDRGLEPLEKRVVQRLLLLDLLGHAGALALEKAGESRLPLADPRRRHFVDETLRACVDRCHLHAQ